MNYRHIFHAGNICDVVKHTALSLLIGHLREKDKPFCVLDTHAGIGLYDLRDERAQKTGEAKDGILKFLSHSVLPDIASYYAVLHSFNPEWRPGELASLPHFRFYPGSPFIAARLLRPTDRLVACELHEEDAKTLKYQAHSFGNVHVHHRDGYAALRAFLPPEEKRGLVIIDPPYEVSNEFDLLAEGVISVQQQWPQGLVMIWYPIKDRPAIWRLHETLIATGIPRQFCAEFIYQQETRHDRLNGCGFILVNPPWQFDEKLQKLFHALHKALQTPYAGVQVSWLTGENKV